MGYFADLFTRRAITCETCAALKYTISIQNSEIEYLRGLLDVERESKRPAPQAQAIKPGFEGNIRKSRVPWSRKQAELETRSAKDAAEAEKQAWKRRVEAVEAPDGSRPV